MILSNFFHKVELDNNIYAIFNSLMMDVLYVDSKKLNEILKFNVKPEEEEKLQNVGIYVKNVKQDEDALNIVKERYNNVSGRVHIMYFVLTSACNLACKYCFIENCTFNNKIEINMKKETALNAIRKYTEYLKKEEIEDAYIGSSVGNEFIELKIKNEEKYLKNLPFFKKLLINANKKMGYEIVCITLNTTNYSVREVLIKINEYRNNNMQEK